MSDKSDSDEIPETVFILGEFSYEGFGNKLNSLGYSQFRKTFKSQPKNWMTFLAGLKFCAHHGKVKAVFIYMPSESLLYASQEAFVPVWEELLIEMKKHRSMIFVYEDNLFGIFHHLSEKSAGEFEESLKRMETQGLDLTGEGIVEYATKKRNAYQKELEDYQSWEEDAVTLLSEITESGVELVPFKRRGEIINRINETLDEVSRGVFLRLYVPRGRYQGEQLEGFLRLFEKYLQQVEGKEFSIDTLKTDHGMTFTFKSRESGANMEEMDGAIQRFDHFMILCKDNPDQAEATLTKLGINSTDALAIISRYSRDYQRIVRMRGTSWSRKSSS